MPESKSSSAAWTVNVRVWVERAGRAMLGQGRLELLEGIDRWHSISAAARQMKMSYRHAWLLVQAINEAAGEPLVVASTGGREGGGARLTPQGRYAVAVFRDLQTRVQHAAISLLPRILAREEPAALHVAAAVSLEEVLGQLLADFTLRQPDLRVRAIFGASDELADYLAAGAPADLFVTADTRHLDRLEAARLVRPGSRAILAANGLAAVGPAEGGVSVHRAADLVRADIRGIALAEPTSPLGSYTRTYLESLSLYQALRTRTVQVDNSRAVLAAVRAGRADVGLVYASDAANSPGCRPLFRVRRTPSPIHYTAAVLTPSRQPSQAQTLLDFLTSRAAAARFHRCGFFPVRDRSG
jgi:molybdate transport system substrate-binding protein